MGRATTIFSAIFLAIGGFLFGYDSGIISSTIALPTFEDYFGKQSDTTTGGIVSAFQGGAILGTIINMFAADWMGRRRTIFAGSCVSCLGVALQAGAASIAMLIVGRFIGGMSIGILTSTIPLYAAELSEAKFRGRFPLAFQLVPSLILLVGVFFLNESPRWLMEKDKQEEARAVLNKLRSGQDQELIDLELHEIRDVIVADRALGKVSWKSIITRPTWRKRLLLGCGVQAFGPLSGINVINYYGPRLYNILGISTHTSLMIIGISGALSIVYCTIGLWMLEKVGRVKPLIVSAAGLAAALLVNAVQAQYFNADNANQMRSMVAMNFVFSLFYTPLGIISWVYPAEIFPVEVRALGNAITTFTNWAVNLIFAQFSPNALSAIEFKYFYVFFVFNILAMVSYIFFFPETKGRTLEQMDELFGDQLVPHALKDPAGAKAAMEKQEVITQEAE
ncbi:hypothetical protein NEMBOFW57_001189 [Staphylotrichum longicolle]|uniref:Major facilitator superfamily (MFS) profile domain-containing protein n=1 Tax=Staphylotrichum longicolle TaxID=669026 RepID=A0AAD4F105_9PEZI|nr:hypothetical protein NEMBOFW57_001189 [Staphylotrichum longicolle]